jgi:hypothetical protein
MGKIARFAEKAGEHRQRSEKDGSGNRPKKKQNGFDHRAPIGFQIFSDPDVQGTKQCIGKSDDLGALGFIGIPHATATDPVWSTDQKFTRQLILFQCDGKTMGVTTLVVGLLAGQAFRFKGNPINAINGGPAKIFIQPGFDFFIFARPQFINNILFHNRFIYHSFLADATWKKIIPNAGLQARPFSF